MVYFYSRSRTMDVSVGVPVHPAKEKPPINVVGDVGGRIAIMVVRSNINLFSLVLFLFLSSIKYISLWVNYDDRVMDSMWYLNSSNLCVCVVFGMALLIVHGATRTEDTAFMHSHIHTTCNRRVDPRSSSTKSCWEILKDIVQRCAPWIIEIWPWTEAYEMFFFTSQMICLFLNPWNYFLFCVHNFSRK